ncbi:MAG: RecQ family ATP-dependent DNA helicase [Bacteroidaceae bacterium]|nr:RecQ family ATP-dependent DNA helicase [Bacteroidaceae bacterium]
MNKDIFSILNHYFGYTSFRGIQQEIIESILGGHDTLGLMPTGGGKSITFQVPALSLDGLCLVVSPLIALMKDQVQHLRKLGIKAAAVYTGMTREEVLVTLENCIFGNYKFLYVSPERLSSDLFQAKLRRMKISFITVDEAHCISQWGYDFRPAYLEIAHIRELLPNCPILALTATATLAVVDDIQRQLRFAAPCVKRMSFERSNLTYSVRRIEQTREAELLTILTDYEGCAIVYTRNRRSTYEIAQWLCSQGVAATNYHAGLPHKERSVRQQAWQNDEVRVMVATNAFGMGIDKPDVRVVVHVDLPDSPEAYFQEAGRAGRDGKPAVAILLYDNYSAGTLKRRIEDTYPPIEYVKDVYDDICYYMQMAVGDGYGVTRSLNLVEFCANFKHFPVRAYNAITILQRAGFLEWHDSEDSHSRLMMACTRDELYSCNLSPDCEQLLWHLLRSYTGLFSEFVYINEERLADDLHIGLRNVNECLIELSRKHVVHFIPRSDIPAITFTQRRVERDELIISKAVYDDRKEQMKLRIGTMLDYLTTHQCHSLFLLNYFGEKGKSPCGRCENCCEHGDELSKQELDSIRHQLLDFLRMNGPTPIRSLHLRGIEDRDVVSVLHQMILDELVEYQNQLPVVALRQ